MSEVAQLLIFNVFVIGLLALDLFVFHRDAHAVSLKEAAGWSAFWIALGLFRVVGQGRMESVGYGVRQRQIDTGRG